jgi:hypothetical protein
MTNTSFRTRTLVVAHMLIGTSLAAQTSVSVGPYVGYYRPFGHFDPASVYITGMPTTPQDLSGAAFGGEADAWFGRRLGASIEAGVSQSTVPAEHTPEGVRGPTSAHVETVVAQALVALPRSVGTHSWISAGLGMVRHAGNAYASVGPASAVAGVLGAGSSFDMNDHIAITAGITTLWYVLDIPMPAPLRQNPGSLERGLQIDATFRVGARWTMRWR